MSISWESIKKFEDIKLERGQNNAEGIIKITINRPDVRNALRPKTVFELQEAFNFVREDDKSGVVILSAKNSWPIIGAFSIILSISKNVIVPLKKGLSKSSYISIY